MDGWMDGWMDGFKKRAMGSSFWKKPFPVWFLPVSPFHSGWMDLVGTMADESGNDHFKELRAF